VAHVLAHCLLWRLGRLVLLAESKNIGTLLLHDQVGCPFDGLKGAEEDYRELSMSC
jgi:hypothetical protein